MSEFVGSLPQRFISFRHLVSKFKAESEAMIVEGGNDPTSSVFEMHPTVEGEVSHGSPQKNLTFSQNFSVEEARQNTDIHVEQTTVVAEGSRSADS